VAAAGLGVTVLEARDRVGGRLLNAALPGADGETATRWAGYMDGAVQSGQRAAREVIAALAPAAGS
jgi:monoamine oxidase